MEGNISRKPRGRPVAKLSPNRSMRDRIRNRLRRRIRQSRTDVSASHSRRKANLGALFASRGDFRQAEFYKQAAIAANPTAADIRRGYGLMLASSRQFDRAAEQMREAVNLHPQSASLHVDLTYVLVSSGRMPKRRKNTFKQFNSLPGKHPHTSD